LFFFCLYLYVTFFATPCFYIGLRYTEGLLAIASLRSKKRSKHAALPAFGIFASLACLASHFLLRLLI
jgi:hypothetical protein